jgi:hypothetical protein
LIPFPVAVPILLAVLVILDRILNRELLIDLKEVFLPQPLVDSVEECLVALL